MMNRRHILAGAAVGGSLLGGVSAVAAPASSGSSIPQGPAPLVNFDRAYALMDANQVDAIAVRLRTNVYYLTGFQPFWWLEYQESSPIAIMTRRQKDQIAIVMAGGALYYQHADTRPEYPYSYYLFSSPEPSARFTSGEPAALTPQPFKDLGMVKLGPVEARRAEALAKAVAAIPPSADESLALRKALRDLGLSKSRIAVDDPVLKERIQVVAPEATLVAGENLVRRIRQVKTPAAIKLAKTIAQANAEASRAAVLSAARPGATYNDLRAAFRREVAVRGGNPVSLLVNMVSSTLLDAEFKQGDAFLIDAVSEQHMMHGDYGRTICIGEPSPSIQRATKAVQLGWRAIQDRLRPGLTFSQVQEIGREALRRDGYDFFVRFTPHNVGLVHTEDPNRRHEPFYVADPVLEAGMVLSVDCPVINTGFGGTVHLEDLVLITADGHQPINDMSQPVILV